MFTRKSKTEDKPSVPLRDVEAENAQEEIWKSEWREAQLAALAALPEKAPFKIWQSNETGWWYVGKLIKETVPVYYRQFEYDAWYVVIGRPVKKPSMKVTAYQNHRAFDPTHLTREDAEQWLRDYLNPPAEKAFWYDEGGTPVDLPPKTT